MNKNSSKDWTGKRYDPFRGIRLRRKSYKAPRPDWDHDHCVICWAKFAEFEGPEILHEGYATTAESKWGEDYHWVCPTCFDDLRNIFGWIEVN